MKTVSLKSTLVNSGSFLRNRVLFNRFPFSWNRTSPHVSTIVTRKLSNGEINVRQQKQTLIQNTSDNRHPANKTNNHRGFKFIIFTSVTIAVSAVIIKKIEDNNQTKNAELIESDEIDITNKNWLFFCYSTLPLNAISRLWGQVNNVTLPEWFRPYGYKFYSSLFGVNLEEMLDPELTHYKNLSEFFYRDITPKSRPIALGPNEIASPSDGKILKLGIIDSETGYVDQVKGMKYSIKELLGTHTNPGIKKKPYTSDIQYIDDEPDIENLRPSHIKYKLQGDASTDDKSPSLKQSVNFLSELSLNYITKDITAKDPEDTRLFYTVIYLAPGDYHHYHSPVNWVCQIRRHFPGALFSVAPYFQRNFHNLFILNERVALLGYWKYGFFSMTPVGATNVGSILLNFDKELITNVKPSFKDKKNVCYEADYSTSSKILAGIPLIKGEDMGGFKLGSTVVLCFEAPHNFQYKVKEGDTVKMGQLLGSIA